MIADKLGSGNVALQFLLLGGPTVAISLSIDILGNGAFKFLLLGRLPSFRRLSGDGDIAITHLGII